MFASGGAIVRFESVVLFTYFISWERAKVEGPARTQTRTVVHKAVKKFSASGQMNDLTTKIRFQIKCRATNADSKF